jgi:hypothetical protein
MKTSEADKYLHLVQALADGETVQQVVNKNWYSFGKDEDIGFSKPPEFYRIKPSIMEFYAIANDDKTDILSGVFETREEVEEYSERFNNYKTIVHMREVE